MTRPSTTWIFCSCGHLAGEHNAGGQCRATSAMGWARDCQSLDVDDEGEA